MTWKSRERSVSDRAEVGSSRSRISGLPLQHARDLDELLLRHFEAAHLGARVDRDAEARKSVARACRSPCAQSILPKRPRGGRPRKMFSATLSAGTRLSS